MKLVRFRSTEEEKYGILKGCLLYTSESADGAGISGTDKLQYACQYQENESCHPEGISEPDGEERFFYG